jgi:hypothetical protein
MYTEVTVSKTVTLEPHKLVVVTVADTFQQGAEEESGVPSYPQGPYYLLCFY